MLAFLQRITFSAPVTGKVAAAKDWRKSLLEDEPLVLVSTGSPPDHRKSVCISITIVRGCSHITSAKIGGP